MIVKSNEIKPGANLRGAGLGGAIRNDETVFPEGVEIPESGEIKNQVGGAAATNQDTLKLRSDGKVTEDKVAENGIKAGDRVGKLIWSPTKIAVTGGNNVNLVVNILNFCDDVTLYALIEIEVTTAGHRTMKVSSDDSIEV